MHVDMDTQYEAVCLSCGRDDVSDLNLFSVCAGSG